MANKSFLLYNKLYTNNIQTTIRAQAIQHLSNKSIFINSINQLFNLINLKEILVRRGCFSQLFPTTQGHLIHIKFYFIYIKYINI